MWHIDENGDKQFAGTKDDDKEAALAARECPDFELDDEDELVSEEPVTCFNCRYRRWTERSFTCCK